MKIAFMFPGQGAQYIGMGQEFFHAYPEAKAVFSAANEILGYDLAELCFTGPEEKLNQTKYSQPGILVSSIACLRVLQREMPVLQVQAAAGLSLGEYTALVAGVALSLTDAVTLVQKRADFMQEASSQVAGGMTSVLGIEEKIIRDILARMKLAVDIANLNSPDQVVISGKLEDIKAVIPYLMEAGAKKTIMLPVSGPFHSRWMEPAKKRLEPYLEKIVIQSPRIGFIANVTATFLDNPKEIKKALRDQVASATYWEKGIRCMLAAGIDTFIEIGPGRTLGGLLRRIAKQAGYFNLENMESLTKLKEALGYALRK